MNSARLELYPQWVGWLEAMYARVPNERAWADGVLAAAGGVFGSPDRCGMVLVTHPPTADSVECRLVRGACASAAESLPRVNRLGVDAVRRFFFPPSLVTTHRTIAQQGSDGERALLEEFHESQGLADAVGLVMHPDPGLVAVMYLVSPHELAMTIHQRRRLTQAALHLEAALRTRVRPSCVLAEVMPDGRIAHLEHGAPAASVLSNQVRRIERARTRRQRNDPDALDLWTALVSGQASLVERVDGARRSYLVVENALARQPMRALTRGELDVVSQAARGLSAKLVAYSLGISQPTVSSRLASAASKLGAATRMELVRFAAMFARDPRARLPDAALTATERELVELLGRGFSNREIARIRNRSVRTIANQVATLLRKTASPTRRALVARAR